jgi:hypothetical protein
MEVLRALWLVCAALQHLTGAQPADDWGQLVAGLQQGSAQLSQLVHGGDDATSASGGGGAVMTRLGATPQRARRGGAAAASAVSIAAAARAPHPAPLVPVVALVEGVATQANAQGVTLESFVPWWRGRVEIARDVLRQAAAGDPEAAAAAALRSSAATAAQLVSVIFSKPWGCRLATVEFGGGGAAGAPLAPEECDRIIDEMKLTDGQVSAQWF